MMPFTIITVKNVPQSLRGDLTKWMQEIATGVYVGNFNSKIREKLWCRVKENVKDGEATLSYAHRNEIGYNFDTINTNREVINIDGIPLIMIPAKERQVREEKLGFSNAAKFRQLKRYANRSKRNMAVNKDNNEQQSPATYTVIDIETDGLDAENNSIIELAAYKFNFPESEEFNSLIEYQGILPRKIKELTGLTEDVLNRDGRDISIALQDFLLFIGDSDLVGYAVDFDIKFINNALKKHNLPLLKNKVYDLIRYVKKEKLFLPNYKLQTVLSEYGIDEIVPHRALVDCRLIYSLSTKVNKFKMILPR